MSKNITEDELEKLKFSIRGIADRAFSERFGYSYKVATFKLSNLWSIHWTNSSYQCDLILIKSVENRLIVLSLEISSIEELKFVIKKFKSLCQS